MLSAFICTVALDLLFTKHSLLPTTSSIPPAVKAAVKAAIAAAADEHARRALKRHAAAADEHAAQPHQQGVAWRAEAANAALVAYEAHI